MSYLVAQGKLLTPCFYVLALYIFCLLRLAQLILVHHLPFVAGAPGPARIPSVAISPCQEGSASSQVSCGDLPWFVPEEPGYSAHSSNGRASHAPSLPLASSAGDTLAFSRLPSRVSSRPFSSFGREMSTCGGRGDARGSGRGCSCGDGSHSGSASPSEPPSSPAMLAAERCTRMKMNAPRVVLPHHTDFCLGEGVALPEVDYFEPAAVSTVTLCTNVTVRLVPFRW